MHFLKIPLIFTLSASYQSTAQMSKKQEKSPGKPVSPSKFDTRKLLTYLAGIAFGLAVMAMYFQPAFPERMVLNQSDILQVKGMSKEIVDHRKREKDEPLWTSRMFGGMPTYQINTAYPNNLLKKVDKAMKLGLPHPAGHMFLLFVGMFVLLWSMRLDPLLCVAGALAYAFSTYFFAAMEAGHNGKINALGYAPMVLAGIMLIYRGKLWSGAGLFTFALGMQLYANHFQITYYLLFMVLALAISELAMSVSFKNRLPLLGLFAVPVIWMVDPTNNLKYVWIGLSILLLLTPLVLEFLKHMKDGGWNAPGFARTRTFVLASLLLLGGGVVAMAPNLGRLYTTQEYAKDTMRGGHQLEDPQHCKGGSGNSAPSKGGGLTKSYAYNWSYGVGETFTLITPFYMGNGSASNIGEDSETYDLLSKNVQRNYAKSFVKQWPTYYGAQPSTSGPVYVGAVIFFLFVLGLLIVGDKYRWWLLAATVLSIFLSWGKNWQFFSDLFFDHFPMYSSFRAVSMTLVIAEIAMPILALLALHKVLNHRGEWTTERILKNVYIAAGSAIGLLLIALVLQPGIPDGFYIPTDLANGIAGDEYRIGRFFGGMEQAPKQLLDQLTSALAEDRSAMLTGSIFRSIGFIAASAGLLFVYFKFIKERFQGAQAWTGKAIVAVGILALILLDLVPINQNYISEESFVTKTKFMEPYNPTPADNQILADKDPNFRVLNLGRDPWNDAFTSYYHKSIGGYHAAKFRRYNDMIYCYLDNEKRAILTGLQNRKPMEALQTIPAMNMLNLKYVMYPTNKGPQVLENPFSYGDAWLVQDFKVVAKNTEEIDAVGQVDLRKTAVVNDEFQDKVSGFKPAFDSSATIRLTSFKANKVTYDFNAPPGKEQLAVFSEIYYDKGWNAYIDGQSAPHFRANYVLRAMRIPGGKHSIEFRFEPQSYATGESIGLIGSLLLMALVIGAVYMDFKSETTQEQDAQI